MALDEFEMQMCAEFGWVNTYLMPLNEYLKVSLWLGARGIAAPAHPAHPAIPPRIHYSSSASSPAPLPSVARRSGSYGRTASQPRKAGFLCKGVSLVHVRGYKDTFWQW
jgi:hypothetical protein